MLTDSILPRLKNIVIAEHLYEFKHVPTEYDAHDLPDLGDLTFEILKAPGEASNYVWESGEREAASIERYLSTGEYIAVLHKDNVIHARASLRPRGWVSVASKRKLRQLAPGEHLLHYVRTSEFARGKGLQVLLYRHIMAGSFEPEPVALVSTVDSRNIPSIKGSERSNGVRVKDIWSVGVLGGRFGFSHYKSLDHASNDRQKSE